MEEKATVRQYPEESKVVFSCSVVEMIDGKVILTMDSTTVTQFKTIIFKIDGKEHTFIQK